jgi:ATP-dependent DNA ligase
MLIKHFPTLYKYSNNQKTMQWEISAISRGDESYIHTVYGYTDGKKQETDVAVKVGKNLGQANATTHFEQACLEAESQWNKKKDKGYTENVSLVKLTKINTFRPMLAKTYDSSIELPDTIAIQPKLDGIRCNYTSGHFFSRQGKEFRTLDHLKGTLDFLFPANLILDGELYAHGEEFQKIISAVKRDVPSVDSKHIEYHIYDCYDIKNPDMPFKDRHKILSASFSQNKNYKVVMVGTDFVKPANLKSKHDTLTKIGYEGMMLRYLDSPYEIDKRSKYLLKYKEFITEEFEIVGTEENKGKCEGECTIICITKDGATFGVKPEGSTYDRQWYWKNRKLIIGKELTVKFFAYTTSDKPVPRFPVGLCVRNYE